VAIGIDKGRAAIPTLKAIYHFFTPQKPTILYINVYFGLLFTRSIHVFYIYYKIVTKSPIYYNFVKSQIMLAMSRNAVYNGHDDFTIHFLVYGD
jgi:hypothetical protein